MTKKISGICVITYFFSYVLRNVLSVATPAMIKEDFFTKEYIGLLSSAYFIFYAVGQLINGFIGDERSSTGSADYKREIYARRSSSERCRTYNSC